MKHSLSAKIFHIVSKLFVVSIIVLSAFQILLQAKAATYTFNQSDWSGGGTASNLAAPTLTTNQYTNNPAASNVVAGASGITLTTTTASLSARTDITQNWLKSIAVGAGMSAMAVSTSGVVSVAYISQEAVAGINNLVYRSSADNFTTPTYITTSTSNKSFTSLALAVGSNGTVHLAYVSLEDGATRIRYRNSSNGWSLVTINPTAGSSADPSITLDSSGTVYIAYRGSDVTYNQIYYRKSSDNWASLTNVTNFPGNFIGTSSVAYAPDYPSIAVGSDGILHVAYQSNEQYISGTAYANIEYRNSATNWTKVDITTSTSANFQYPTIKLDASNTAYIADITQFATVGLAYTTSSNYTAWSAPVVINNTISGAPYGFAVNPTSSVVYALYGLTASSLSGYNLPTFSANGLSASNYFPMLGIDSSGSVHSVIQSQELGSGITNLAYRKYSGAWSARTNVTTNYGDPGITNVVSAVDASGTIHVAYLSKEADPNHAVNNIAYRKSTDSGVTWSARQDITATSTNVSFGGLQLTTTPGSNTVHIVYVSKEKNGYSNVVYRSSANNWNEIDVTTSTSLAASTPSIFVEPSGKIHIAYYGTASGVNIFYKNSTDGINFSSQITVYNYNQSLANPSIAVDSNGKIHVAFGKSDPGGSGVIYENSSNGGASFGGAQTFDYASGGGASPSLFVDSTNKIHIVYYWIGASKVVYQRSIDGGTTFSSSTVVSSGTPLVPSVSVGSNGVVNVAYVSKEFNGSYYNVAYRSSADGVIWSGKTDITTSTAGSVLSSIPPSFNVASNGQIIFVHASPEYNSSLENIALRTFTPSVYNSSGTLVSQAYNTGDPTNVIGLVSWNEATSTGSSVKVSVRTAPDSAGSSGTWSSWQDFTDTTTGCAISPATITSTSSIFTSQTPGTASNYLGEQGTIFQSSVNGQITGIRFYKPSSEGAQTGNIYSTSGTLLATVALPGGSGSGWQTATLSSPLNITAGTTYVVTRTYSKYYSAAGTYPVTNGPLTAQGGVDKSGATGFPGSTNDGSGYHFVDVVFSYTSPTGQNSVSCGGSAIPSALKSNSQYWQYQVTETSTGATTPTVSNVTVKYVINAAPAIGSVTVSQNTTAVDPVNPGKVKISYTYSDPDSSGDISSNPNYPSGGYLRPSYEYSLDNGSTWNAIVSSTLSTSADIAASSTTSTLTTLWNAPAQLGATSTSNLKIRVTLNDFQLANNTVQGISAAGALDTASPTGSITNLNISAGTLSFSLSDNTPGFSYRFSSSPIASSTPTSTVPWITVPAVSTSTTITWNFNNNNTVYGEAQDIYGNDYTFSSAAPVSVANFNVMGNVLSWTAYNNAPSATWQKYELYRSSGGAFSLLTNSVAQGSGTVNYTDTSAVAGTTYFYKIRVIDTDGDSSQYTSSQILNLNASAGTLALAFQGSSALQYRMSNNIFSTSTPSGTLPWITVPSGFAFSTSTPWTFASTTNPTVYYEVSDGYGNDVVYSAVAPAQPQNFQTRDLTNLPAGIYGEALSWTATTNTTGATTSYYEIWKQTGTAPYVLLATTTQNSFLDYNVTSGNKYAYKSRVVDTNGDIGLFSVQQAIIPSGALITNVATSSITSVGATITWTTDSFANSVVEYGTSTSYGFLQTGSDGNTKNHTVSLSGLTPLTAYYFRVKSTDQYGNTSVDDNNGSGYQFTTQAPPFPIISGVTSSGAATSTATINWTTNVNSNSTVWYSTSTASLMTNESGPVHSDNFAGAAGTLLATHDPNWVSVGGSSVSTFKLDGNGNVYVFTTDWTGGEVMYAGSVSDTSQITWKAQTGAGELTKGLCVRASAGVNGYCFSFSSFSNGLYQSIDLSKNGGWLDGASGQTISATTDHVLKLVASGTGTVTLKLYVDGVLKRTTVDSNSPINSGHPGFYVAARVTPSDTALSNWSDGTFSGAPVYSVAGNSSTTSHTALLAGLTSSAQYYYYVQSADAYSQTATNDNTGSFYTFTTTAPAPTISNVASSSTSTSATITWSTNYPANSSVYYGTATSSVAGWAHQDDATPVTSHSITITGLPSSVKYYFYVKSTDSQSQSAIDNNSGNYYSFITSAAADTQAPTVPTSLAATSASSTQVNLTWVPSNDNVGVAGYNIFRNGSKVASTTLATFTDSGLTASTTYAYTVSAFDAAGNESAQSATATVSTLEEVRVVISGVSSTAVTANSAVISWATNQNADSWVNYATSAAAVASSTPAGSGTQGIAHAVSLSNLIPSTTYYFSIKSTDGLGHTTTDTNGGAFYVFTTQPRNAPVISNVTSTATDYAATITWTTDRLADSLVYYGIGAANLQQGSPNPTQSHWVTLQNLTPSSSYVFYVQSTDAQGNAATSSQFGFTTNPDVTPPVISGVQVSGLTNQSFTITWATNESATGDVLYSTTTGSYTATSTANVTPATSHTAVLTGLSPNTTYYFVIRSVDLSGNVATTTEANIRTFGADAVAPQISNVTSTGVSSNQATITWVTDITSDSWVRYATSSDLSAASIVGSSTLVQGSAPFIHSLTLPNLTPQTQYYYAVESKSDKGMDALDSNNGQGYAFFTQDVPPQITDVQVPITSETGAIVTWTTNVPATSEVDYGTASSTYTNHVISAEPTTHHIAQLSGLTSDATYYFVARSASVTGLTAQTEEKTFTTVAQVVTVVPQASGNATIDTTPPQITDISIDPVNSFDATVNFSTSKPTMGFVSYGTSTLDSAAGDTTFGYQHKIQIKGLSMGTQYLYRIAAIDKNGNQGSAPQSVFNTKFFSEGTVNAQNAEQFQKDIEDAIASALPSLVPPFIEKPQVTDITENSATIEWRTNVPAYSVVAYAPETGFASSTYPNKQADLDNKVTDHAIKLTQLTPNTTYHFMVQSFRLPEVVGKSADYTFLTKASEVQPRISEVKTSSFVVAWTTDAPTDSTVDYTDVKTGVTRRYTENEQKTLHSITIENLTPGKTYSVKVSGYTEKGNLVQSSNAVSVTTSRDLIPPKILNVKIDTALNPNDPTRAQAIISWTTDKPATSIAYYEEGTGAGGDKILKNKVTSGENFTTDHTMIVPSLVPGSIYRIQVESVDEPGNDAKSPIRTVIIPRQAESIFDVIFKNFSDTFKFLQSAGH